MLTLKEIMCGEGIILFVCVCGGGPYLVHKQLNDTFTSALFDCAKFVVRSFNYFERLGLVISMYHMFIVNQQVASWKSAMPYNYPQHVANSCCLFG